MTDVICRSSQKPLKFCHITKTAGTSIEEAAREKGILWGKHDEWYLEQFGHYHAPISNKPQHELAALKSRYAFFAIVRDPVDRCLSEFFCRWGNVELHQYASDDFELTRARFNLLMIAFLVAGTRLNFLAKYLNPVRPGKKPHYAEYHWSPQSDYTHFNGVQIVDHLINLRSLSGESLKALMRPEDLNLELKQKNVSRRRMQAQDMYLVTKLIIRFRYRRDYKYLSAKSEF